MAKKRKKGKKEEEEEYEFTPPEFDEKEFLQKEIKDTKSSLITIAIAVVFGILAGGLAAIDRALVAPALLIGLAGVIFLKYIYQLLKVDISHFQRRNWLGAVGTFFFTFLAVTVLMINVPFIDLANPTVDKVIIWVDDGGVVNGAEYKFNDEAKTFSWVGYDNWTPTIRATSTVNLTAHIADNGKLTTTEVAIVPTVSVYHAMLKYGDSRYNYSFKGDQLSGQALLFYIHAVDSAGNEVQFNPTSTIPFV